jgi:CrcB protein
VEYEIVFQRPGRLPWRLELIDNVFRPPDGGAMNYLVQSIFGFLTPYVAIGIAASLGAISRYAVSRVCDRFFGNGFPVGTLVINISASFLLGWFLTAIKDRMVVSDTVRLAVAVGFIGTYSTFSTFAFESNALLEDGSVIKATVNMFGSLLVGIVAVRLGAALAGG